MRLRVIFAGTPAFAQTALAEIHAAGFAVPLVLTQPDRPAGRGMQVHPSPVKQFALANHLSVLQPTSLRTNGRYAQEASHTIEVLQATPYDVMVVAAYGLLLPQEVLDIPESGCINIHASLLPRWRGAAPIQRALEAGDSQTGISLMQMEAGLDTGPILATEALSIMDSDTSASLHDRLAKLGAHMIVTALSELADGLALPSIPQPGLGVCYAEKIRKEEAYLDCAQDAQLLARRIRAFNPVPGVHTVIRGQRIKIWQGHALSGLSVQILGELSEDDLGTILDVNSQGIWVACKNSVLCLTELQKAGGKRLPLSGFLQSFPLVVGERLEFLHSALT